MLKSIKGLERVVSSTLLSASLIFLPVKSSALVERPSEIKKEFSIEKVVPIKDQYGKDYPETLTIKAQVDEEGDKLYFTNYTENYDKQNWEGEEKEIPLLNRYTPLNSVYSQTFILHPKEVGISGIKEEAFVIPGYIWDDKTRPYEEHATAQVVTEIEKGLLDYVLSKIPFLNEAYDFFIKKSEEKASENLEENFKKIKEEYVVTEIPRHIPDNLMSPITARDYEISFDMSKTKGKVPLFLWQKIAVGEPSQATHGSFPNRYGELENILIEFSLKNENKPKNIEWFFLQSTETENLKIVQQKILTPLEIGEWRNDDKVFRNLTGIGSGDYTILPENDGWNSDINLMIFQFKDELDAWELISKEKEEIEDSLICVKDNKFIFLDYDILDYKNDNVSEQNMNLANTLINYIERTGCNFRILEAEDEMKKYSINPSDINMADNLKYQLKLLEMDDEELKKELVNKYLDCGEDEAKLAKEFGAKLGYPFIIKALEKRMDNLRDPIRQMYENLKDSP